MADRAASDESKLVVRLEASVTNLIKEMSRARQHTQTEMGLLSRSVDANLTTIERRRPPKIGLADAVKRESKEATTALRTLQSDLSKGSMFGGTALATSLRTTIGGALAGISAAKISEYADTDTRARNSLKVAGLEGEALKKTYDDLFQSAQRNLVPIESLTTLYGRLSMSQKELKVSSAEIAKFTDGVAVALRVSGQSAEQTSGALLQLSQAMGGGKIQAEEYNSLIDGARPVLMAVAAGMEEAGGSVSKLTQLVKDGKVSSEAFFRAFEAGRPMLDELASKTTPTLAQEMVRVQNALVVAAGEMSRMAGAADLVRSAFEGLIAVISQAPEIFKRDLADLAKIAAVAQSIANSIRVAAGTTAIIKDEPGEESGYEPLVMRIKPKAPNVELEDTGPKDIKPISLKSYKVPGDDKGGGGGKSGADRVNEFEREVQALEKRTRAIGEETAAVGKSSLEAARAEAQFKLLEAAKAANLPITDELRGKVDALAGSYAAAKVQLEEAQTAQRAAQEQSRFLGQELTDSLGDLIIEGDTLSDVFDNLTKSLARAAMQAALMGTGPLASLFGTTAAKSGDTGGLLGMVFEGVKSLKAADGYVPGYASGRGALSPSGIISGPGTTTSDSILARVSNREAIIRASSVEHYGGHFIKAINDRSLPRFADGGLVDAELIRQGAAMRASPAMTAPGGNLASSMMAPITINMQGSSGNAAMDRNLAENVGRIAAQQVRATMMDVIQREARTNGSLWKMGVRRR